MDEGGDDLSDFVLTDVDGTERFRGSSRGGAVQVARTVIPHADILTLPSTPVELVAAPGAGLLVFPVAALLICDTTAGAYTGLAGTPALSLDPDGTFNVYSLAAQLGGSFVDNVLAAGQVSTATMLTAGVVPASAGPTGLQGSANLQDPAAYDGMPLLLTLSNNGGNPAPLGGGDAANSLAVTVVYAILDASAS